MDCVGEGPAQSALDLGFSLPPLRKTFFQLQVALLGTQLSRKGEGPASGPDQAWSLCMTSVVWVEYYREKNPNES